MTTSATTRIGPIRIVPLTATREEIRRRNQEEHGRANHWDEDVQGLVERIRSIPWKDTLDLDVVRRWATHPDERVRVALIRSGVLGSSYLTRELREIVGLILDADAKDRDEGDLWTPTLDALTTLSGRWWTSEKREEGEEASVQKHGPHVWVDEKVASALNERSLNAEEAIALLKFTKFLALKQAVIDAVRPSPGLVGRMIEDSPDSVVLLAGREDLDEATLAELWRHVLEACRSEQPRFPFNMAIMLLRKRGALPHDAFEQLLGIAEEFGASERPDIVEHLHDMIRDGQMEKGREAEHLLRFYRLVRLDWGKVRDLVQYRVTDEALAAEIARDTDYEDVRTDVIYRFGSSKEVRRAILDGEPSHGSLVLIAWRAEGEELIEILDRLAENDPAGVLNLLGQRTAKGELDGSAYGDAIVRYYERLIDRDPRRAVDHTEMVCRHLGETKIRREWARRIIDGLIDKDPEAIYRLDQQYFEDLVPEDWQSFLRHPTTACEILLRVPSARHDPAAREFILQHGSRTAVFELLGRDPVPPGEVRAAALAILQVCPWDFDSAFERWPELKAGLGLADIACLLESDNGMVRQKAILILGGLQAPPSAAVSRESERRTQA